MTTIAIIFSILLGLIISGLATSVASFIGKKPNLGYWLTNVILGVLGSVAASQLLPGAYGPVFAGVTIVPSIIGALVLAGVGSWAIKKFSK